MEYKFRGFDATGQKGWVYGDLVHNKKVTKTGLEDRVMVGGYEVVPESVGIYTGTKNWKGVELYEGDIVYLYYNEPNYRTVCSEAVLEWVDAGFRYHIESAFLTYKPFDRCCDIISNVFERKMLNESLD